MPFTPALDGDLAHKLLHATLSVLFVGSALCLLFNVSVRLSAFIAGAAVFVSILASKPFYSNNMLYGSLLLILTGLFERRAGCWILRLQTAIMYLGAGLNKLMEPDWRSGQFFQHWFGVTHHHLWFIKVGAAFPPLLFSRLTSSSIIFLELAFVPALLYRRTAPLAMWTVIAYHTGIVALTGSTFGVFYYSIGASMLAFVDWPQRPFRISFVSEKMARLAKGLRHTIDPDGAFVALSEERRSMLVVGKTTETGVTALLRALLLCPATYFLLLFLIKLPESVLHMRRPITIIGVLLFAPVAFKSAARSLRMPAARLISRPTAPSAEQEHVA